MGRFSFSEESHDSLGALVLTPVSRLVTMSASFGSQPSLFFGRLHIQWCLHMFPLKSHSLSARFFHVLCIESIPASFSKVGGHGSEEDVFLQIPLGRPHFWTILVLPNQPIHTESRQRCMSFTRADKCLMCRTVHVGSSSERFWVTVQVSLLV